ncbi:MAG: NUDIX domain-containing protein [Puniceicoccaceae bacterium]
MTKLSRKNSRSVRVAARALICEGDTLLTIQMRDQSGIFHILPGGGQNHGETLKESLGRECREELGCEIEVGELCYVREYIGGNHKFSNFHQDFHQLEVVFKAKLLGEPNESAATETDRKQVGIEWISFENLRSKRFLPEALISILTSRHPFPDDRYLGDVN